jgi:ArsR family transcriptional regulator
MTNKSEQLAVQFKALADPVRMRLVALCRQGECSVSDLTRVVRLSQPRVSQHLKQLCDAGILQRFRDGKWVIYRIAGRRSSDSETSRRLLELIPRDDPVFQEDRARLRELRGDRVASAGFSRRTVPGFGSCAAIASRARIPAMRPNGSEIGCFSRRWWS